MRLVGFNRRQPTGLDGQPHCWRDTTGIRSSIGVSPVRCLDRVSGGSGSRQVRALVAQLARAGSKKDGEETRVISLT